MAHLGWDINNKGLELDSVDSQLQQFFNNAGVSEHELQDKGTRKFIYDFIERNGGMSAVQEDIRPLVNAKNSNQPPALPQRQEYPPPVPARTITVSFNLILNILNHINNYYLINNYYFLIFLFLTI